MLTDLLAVEADSAGNFLEVDRVLSTFLFSPSGKLIMQLNFLGAPLKIVCWGDDTCYSLIDQEDGTFIITKFGYRHDTMY